MNSLQGHLLIASPELEDPNFARSVVLIVRHNDEGAFGLILNRPTNIKISEAWKQISEEPCQRDGLLFIGGPCEGTLTALHTGELHHSELHEGESSEAEVGPNLKFSSSREDLEALITQQQAPVKFLVGYSGWGAGQLEMEMQHGGWLYTPASIEHVFENECDLWDTLTKQIADSNLISALGIKHVPPDPSLN